MSTRVCCSCGSFRFRKTYFAQVLFELRVLRMTGSYPSSWHMDGDPDMAARIHYWFDAPFTYVLLVRNTRAKLQIVARKSARRPSAD